MEDKILISNIKNKIIHTNRYFVISNTNFLDPYQVAIANNAVKGEKHCFFGGFDDCERKMLFIVPDYADTDELDISQYMNVITITPASTEKIGHRDYLGSILGLGIRRDKIGDIIVFENDCDVIVMSDIADFIYQNLNKIGRTSASCEIKSINKLRKPLDNYEEMKVIASSLRLDCILSSVFKLSRKEATSLVQSRRVFINWQLVEQISKNVKQGDTITLRGKGRFTLNGIVGNTKKGRLVLEVTKAKDKK